MTTPCCWPFCGAEPNECDCEDNMHTKHAETNTPSGTCIGSVPLPEPGFVQHGACGGPYTADQLRAYGDERERAAFARVSELEAALEREKEAMFAALSLIADIRKAAGDPEGKLMQAELVELIGRQREECDQMRAAESAAIAAGGGDD